MYVRTQKGSKMSTTEEQLESIDVSIEMAQKSVNNMTDLIKLTSNKEFKNIIEEGYFVKEASRLVLVKADPSQQGEAEQAAIEKAINAIGFLRQYFVQIMQIGRMNEKAIIDDELTREDILAGEV